jgi:hypothetical protein
LRQLRMRERTLFGPFGAAHVAHAQLRAPELHEVLRVVRLELHAPRPERLRRG